MLHYMILKKSIRPRSALLAGALSLWRSMSWKNNRLEPTFQPGAFLREKCFQKKWKGTQSLLCRMIITSKGDVLLAAKVENEEEKVLRSSMMMVSREEYIYIGGLVRLENIFSKSVQNRFRIVFKVFRMSFYDLKWCFYILLISFWWIFGKILYIIYYSTL